MSSAGAGEPLPSPLEGYATPGEIAARLAELAKSSDRASVTTIGKDAQGEPIPMVTLDAGARPAIPAGITVPSLKPAIVVLGGVDPEAALGTELAWRLAERLADPDEAGIAEILEAVTVHIIPCPAPTASARAFARPLSVSKGNRTPTDDDRDFEVGEDPPIDLDGNGVITSMRIEDPRGPWMAHPSDPRVLIKADAAKGERGRYRLVTEGRDADHDEAFGEDGAGGVALDRNGPFDPLDFQPHAGSHPASEAETRAVIDFIVAHPEVAAVVVFGPEDTIHHPWKANAEKAKQRIKTTIAEEDAAALKAIATDVKPAFDRKEAPSDEGGHGGSLVRWAYFHTGRWAVSTPGWCAPPLPKARDAKDEPGDKSTKSPDETKTKPQAKDSPSGPPETDAPDEAPPAKQAAETAPVTPTPSARPTEASADQSAEAEPAKDDEGSQGLGAADKADADEKRGQSDRARLAYLEGRKLGGFVPWTRIDHPDLPGKAVEIGGLVPYAGVVPPADSVPELTDAPLAILKAFAERRPRLEIVDAEAVRLGGGLIRLRATVLNTGRLPTTSAMGVTTGGLMPLWAEWDAPPGTRAVTGSLRAKLPVLDPLAGNHADVETIVRLAATDGDGAAPRSISLTVWAPHVGVVRVEVPITAAAKQ